MGAVRFAERDKLIVADRWAGMSTKKIADKYGMNRGAVQAVCRKGGYKHPFSGNSGKSERNWQMWSDRLSGASYLALAAKHGITASRCRQAVERCKRILEFRKRRHPVPRWEIFATTPVPEPALVEMWLQAGD